MIVIGIPTMVESSVVGSHPPHAFGIVTRAARIVLSRISTPRQVSPGEALT